MQMIWLMHYFFYLSIENPPDWINVGTGKDQTILELANLVKHNVDLKVKLRMI